MKLPTCIFLLSAAATTEAFSQSMNQELCGFGQVNDISVSTSVSENPDGYYLPGLKTQLSHGDPRIIRDVGSEFRVCTRPAAIPEMDITQMHIFADKREVTFLFVPSKGCKDHPNS